VKEPFTILLAEDDENDILLATRALQKIGSANSVQVCRDGEEATLYLQGAGRYSDRCQFPFPRIVISDLKMPRKGGMEILRWLKNHPACHVIPFIILSASNEPNDVRDAYRAGANCYLKKPSSFEQLQQLLKATFDFWYLCEKPEVPSKC
jgi:CheY-like chemotaxis protein